MLLTTPMTIRTLQRKLYEKAKLEIGACLGVKNIGKPCAGKPHARFDEGGQARACLLLYRRCFVTRRCFAPPSLEDAPSSPAERAKNTLERARKGIDDLPQNRSIGQKLGRAIKPAVGLSAEASLTLRGCLPPITW